MAHVVLINPFEVPKGKDEEFLAEWEAAKAFMERQPGYVSTRLHRSLNPHARSQPP
jgi:heme oxygenase (mycobilin-producing)